MIDLETKKRSALTTGEYYINSVLHTDEDKEEIYFIASGKAS